MKYRGVLIVFLVLWLGGCMPVMGVTTYLGGSPEMSAVVAGTNEFTAGEDAVIRITVQNQGVASMQFVMKGSIARTIFPQLQKGLQSDFLPGVLRSLSGATHRWSGM